MATSKINYKPVPILGGPYQYCNMWFETTSGAFYIDIASDKAAADSGNLLRITFFMGGSTNMVVSIQNYTSGQVQYQKIVNADA